MVFKFLSKRRDSWKTKTLLEKKLFYSNLRNYRLLFIGPPGVGKGTFAKIIAPQLNANVIDTGRILRKITSHHQVSNNSNHQHQHQHHHNHIRTHSHNKHNSYCSGLTQNSLGHYNGNTINNMNHQSINYAHTNAYNDAINNSNNNNNNNNNSHDDNHHHHENAFDSIPLETKKLIETYMAKGELVPDNVLLPIMLSHLLSIKSSFILDGFPRTLSQIKWLHDHNFYFDLAIRFHLPDHILIAKMLGRRTCRDCGNTYNVADINNMNDEKLGISLPLLNPKNNQNKCDECNGNLISRSEDTMHTLEHRMSIYYQQTEPIIQFLNEKNNTNNHNYYDDNNNSNSDTPLLNFNIKKGVEDSSLLLSQIKETLEHKKKTFFFQE